MSENSVSQEIVLRIVIDQKGNASLDATPQEDEPVLQSEPIESTEPTKDIRSFFAVDKRQKERYSFEIFSDQKEHIQQACELYKAKTGKNLSASHLLRQSIDSFLPGMIKSLEDL